MDINYYATKILIVDDEESIRQTFEIFLSSEGYQFVDTVATFDEAMKAMSHTSYDLIISDIVLIGSRGTDLLKEIRESGVKCPVVMITGFPNLESAAESLRYGAFDYISKPINKETLLRFTRLALKHWYLENKTRSLQLENERYRRHLETIFNSVSESIITVDINMQIIQLNDTAKQELMAKGEEGLFSLKQLPEKLYSTCLDDAKKVLKKRVKVKNHLIEFSSSDDKSKVFSLTTSPLNGENDQIQGVVFVIGDMTVYKPSQANDQRNHFHGFVGSSPALQKVYNLIENVGKVDTAVLITGETGTGKELAAEALHIESLRWHKPLIKVDCVSFTEDLLESELFGHKKGSFTGADHDRDGRLLIANKGTLFLDEIGDISPRNQLLFLRFLQEKTFTPIGQNEPIHVDVRIIAATNVDFQEKVQKGTFREDLYYRLKVIEIELPSLRELGEDIILIANYFLGFFCKKLGKKIVSISDQAAECMMEYFWPGNVRQLKHVIERACVLCDGPVLLVNHLPAEILHHKGTDSNAISSSQLSSHQFKHSYVPHQTAPSYQPEKQKILEALEMTNGNKLKAAKLLGIARSTLYRQLHRYKIE